MVDIIEIHGVFNMGRAHSTEQAREPVTIFDGIGVVYLRQQSATCRVVMSPDQADFLAKMLSGAAERSRKNKPEDKKKAKGSTVPQEELID